MLVAGCKCVASPGAGVIVVMGLGGDLPAIEVVGYWEGTLLGGRDSAASPRIGVITVLGLESDLSATDFFFENEGGAPLQRTVEISEVYPLILGIPPPPPPLPPPSIV